MSGRLTAYDIRIMLLDLDIAEKNREHREIHWKSINEVRQALLRASLSDVEVEVETEEKP